MVTKITFVTSNKGKLNEARERFGGLDMVIGEERLRYPEVQADTLVEVARTSANWLKTRVETPFFLDDSGMFIKALDGFPGVYSAYVYRTLGPRGILTLMKGRSVREAVFRTVIAFMDERNRIHLFEGECRGEIIEELRGKFGFGYDPIFRPEGAEMTFAQMETEAKNRISHRAMAFHGLAEHLKKDYCSE